MIFTKKHLKPISVVFSTLLPFWHPKYPPEMVVITAVFMVWRAGAPPSPLLAHKGGELH